MACRYDLSNLESSISSKAGIKTPILEETEKVILFSQFDRQGRRPVQISSVSIPKLSLKQTPIYTSGLATFFGLHVIFIVASLTLPEEVLLFNASIERPTSSLIAMKTIFGSYSVGWVSTILIPAVMLIRAYFTKEGALKLWRYEERWWFVVDIADWTKKWSRHMAELQQTNCELKENFRCSLLRKDDF